MYLRNYSHNSNWWISQACRWWDQQLLISHVQLELLTSSRKLFYNGRGKVIRGCVCTVPKIRDKYSQKWNCAASFPISTFMYLWAIYIFHDRSIYFAVLRLKTDRGNIHINRSQIHECRNWEKGRAVSFLGIFGSNFRDSAFALCPFQIPRPHKTWIALDFVTESVTESLWWVFAWHVMLHLLRSFISKQYSRWNTALKWDSKRQSSAMWSVWWVMRYVRWKRDGLMGLLF